MKNEIDSKYYIFMVVLCALFFACGYKVGDSSGYKDGYEVGYRYDCKEEIATIYSQVKAQTKAIAFTDSSMKQILHQNDSLKKREYYQKRHLDSLSIVALYSDDSLKYSIVAEKYSDSVCRAARLPNVNLVQANGQVNFFVCNFVPEYKNLPECRSGFDVRSRLDKMLRGKKKKGKK